jgi:hypothetical protein
MTNDRLAELVSQLSRAVAGWETAEAEVVTLTERVASVLRAHQEEIQHSVRLEEENTRLRERLQMHRTCLKCETCQLSDREMALIGASRQAAKKADGPDVSEPPTESFEKEDDEPLGRASAAPTAQDKRKGFFDKMVVCSDPPEESTQATAPCCLFGCVRCEESSNDTREPK